MDKQGNLYTFLYASVMVIVVAAALALVSTGLKDRQDKNIEVAKQMDILKSVGIQSDATNAADLYKKYIGENTKVVGVDGNEIQGVDAFTVDMSKEIAKKEGRNYPLYICTLDNGDVKYIIPMRGAGLWDAIWGYISLDSDKKTVYGVTFDHAGETPGLGAEITTEAFQKPFVGKTIAEGDTFTSVKVLKGGGTESNPHAVDALSGATLTCDGVTNMLEDCLKGYEKYFNN